MTEIVVLPPQACDPQLTVKVACQSLGEHQQAFLASNNISGYLAEPDRILTTDRIGDLILMLAASAYITMDEFKAYIKVLLKVTSSRNAAAILRRSLGYHEHQKLPIFTDEKGVECIPNRLLKNAHKHIQLADYNAGFTRAEGSIHYIKRLQDDDPLKEKLMELEIRHEVTLQEAHDYAAAFRDITSKQIKLGKGYDIVSYVLGYEGWSKAKRSAGEGVIIRNLNKEM